MAEMYEIISMQKKYGGLRIHKKNLYPPYFFYTERINRTWKLRNSNT